MFRKGTLDFSLEFVQMLQNESFKQRYITLNATNHSWLRQNLLENPRVQNFFAGYMFLCQCIEANIMLMALFKCSIWLEECSICEKSRNFTIEAN